MISVLLYALISIFIISLLSFIGLISFGFKPEKLKSFLIYVISFSAGALLGDAFIHLLPELSFTLDTSLYILLGILIFFILEKVVQWRHCHMPITKQHIHPFAYMNLVGDALHNFIDGIIITTSYLISIPAGFATTLAVVFHEIPQKIGDIGILLHGGFSRKKALWINFAISLTAFIGAILTFWLSGILQHVETFLIPITIGGFIYIAGSDLIPEMHKEKGLKQAFFQTIAFILGILVMLILMFFG